MSIPAGGVPATGPAIRQVALVVRDLDRAMAHWCALGIGPWRVYTFGPHNIGPMTLRGQVLPHASLRLAFAAGGAFTYELIQPLEGPSIYAEFLASQEEGLHHLGYVVEDIEAEIAAMAAKGYAVLQGGTGHGLDRDGAYAYFDTGEGPGCILEAIKAPARMPPAERSYPAAAPS